MGRKQRLAKVAVVRGEFALLVFHDAAADGRIEGAEIPTLYAALMDWHATSKATDVAQALGEAMNRGIEDTNYQDRLFGAYRSTVDELPQVPA